MNINFDGDLRTDSEEEEEEEEISDVGTVNPCWQNAPQQLCKYLYAQASRAHVMRKSKRLIRFLSHLGFCIFYKDRLQS